MKTPEEYLDNQLKGPERPATVSYAEALAAVTAVLGDAERYRNNLVRALRNLASPAALTYLDIVAPEPAPETGTVKVGSQVLPWRVWDNPAPVSSGFGEKPPF